MTEDGRGSLKREVLDYLEPELMAAEKQQISYFFRFLLCNFFDTSSRLERRLLYLMARWCGGGVYSGALNHSEYDY